MKPNDLLVVTKEFRTWYDNPIQALNELVYVVEIQKSDIENSDMVWWCSFSGANGLIPLWLAESMQDKFNIVYKGKIKKV